MTQGERRRSASAERCRPSGFAAGTQRSRQPDAQRRAAAVAPGVAVAAARLEGLPAAHRGHP
ncbi:hypothetical protein M8494_09115 [Serratia ureilytica]